MMVNERTYYLDLQTLLALLRNKQGTLTTTIKLREYKATGTGTITFAAGRITACKLDWGKGRLEGDEAYLRLRDVQEWKVHFETPPPQYSPLYPSPAENSPQVARRQQPTPPPLYTKPRPPARTYGSRTDLPPNAQGQQGQRSMPITTIPQPFQLMTQAEFAAFSGSQRQLLQTLISLIDGHRSVETILAQLPYPAETILQALEVLRNMDKILY